MNNEEIAYLLACLNITIFSFGDSPNINKVKSLKFNAKLDSGKDIQQKWDGTIDAFLSIYDKTGKDPKLLNIFLQLVQENLLGKTKSSRLTHEIRTTVSTLEKTPSN
ncbi:MAG: hypothetical protein PHY14_05120 [Candidatus Gracilibacteria bacterium]|nr:hypothetical protein [Candidatus Gracilibacteria bacterium]